MSERSGAYLARRPSEFSRKEGKMSEFNNFNSQVSKISSGSTAIIEWTYVNSVPFEIRPLGNSAEESQQIAEFLHEKLDRG